MSTSLGNYQNSIPSLSALDLVNYERIFKVYEASTDDKSFYFYNILKKIELPSTIDDSVLEYYTVRANMPLTTVSFKIYDDIRLWWIIYLVNRKTLGEGTFVVKGGTQLAYIKRDILPLVFQQITNIIVYNGRHY
jgi:hypothetical protein